MIRYLLSRLGLVKRIAILEMALRNKGAGCLKKVIDLEIGEEVIAWWDTPYYLRMRVTRKEMSGGFITVYASYNNGKERAVFRDYADVWLREYNPFKRKYKVVG